MALLTALLGAYGGYGQGRQQRTQNQQEQERLNQDQAYREAELSIEEQRAKREQDTYTRSTGIDPATGKPFVMPASLNRIVPGNVGPNYKPTLEDTYRHQMLWYSTLQGQGRADEAAGWLAQAQETARQMNAQQSENATLNRELQVLPLRLQGEEAIHGEPTYADLHPKPLTPSEQMDQDQEAWNRQHGYPPGYRGGGAGKSVTPEQAQDASVKWRDSFQKATAGGQHYQFPNNPPGQQGKLEGKAPLVSTKDISGIRSRLQALRAHGYKGPLDPFAAIDADSDPLTLSKQLADMTGNQTLKALLLQRGSLAVKQRQSQQPQYGGSDADGNPQYPGQ